MTSTDEEDWIDFILRARKLSSTDGKTLEDALWHVQEEAGEVARAWRKGYDRPDKDKAKEPYYFELVDTILCSLDCLFKAGFTIGQILEMADKKMNRWARNCESNTKSR